jgi:tetratricopeptide (TPR) repeat protein
LSGSIGTEQISDNNISAIYKHLGKFSTALENYQHLYNKAIRENDKGRQSLALNHMGDIFRILNRMDESERCHHQCIQLCDEFGKPERKALAFYRLGLMYLSTWQLQKAYDSIYEASTIYHHIGTNQEINRFLVGFARLDLCRGEFGSAMNKLTKALEALGKINDWTWLGRANLNFSLFHLHHGQPEDALSKAEVAYDAFSQDDHWRLCEAKIILSRCYVALGRFDLARRAIEEAKPMFLQFGLFHRLNQIDNLEALVNEAENSEKPVPFLSADELQYNFGYLGL